MSTPGGTTDQPNVVNCRHCGATLNLTPDLLAQLMQGQVIVEPAPGVRWLVDPHGWAAWCPKSFVEELAADTPCPAWCTLPPGHPYDVTGHDGRDLFRYHDRHIGVVSRVSVDITSGESLVDGQVVETDRPHVTVGDDSAAMTATDLDQLAEMLRSAARLLEEIER